MACGAGPDVGCKFVNAMDPSSLSIGTLDAGTYFLVVDGYGPTPAMGPFTVTAYQGTPPGDSCTSATRRLTMGGGETVVTIAGDSTGMASDVDAVWIDRGIFEVGSDLELQHSGSGLAPRR